MCFLYDTLILRQEKRTTRTQKSIDRFKHFHYVCVCFRFRFRYRSVKN